MKITIFKPNLLPNLTLPEKFILSKHQYESFEHYINITLFDSYRSMNEEIIIGCKKGSNSAQKQLYEYYAPRMYRLCFRYVKSEIEAEDILNNSFMKVFQNIIKFQYLGAQGVNAWIKKIIINESLMFLRKKKHLLFVDENEGLHIEGDFSVDRNLAAEEIYNLILELPTGYRTIFNLHSIEGYNHKEISELLKISENTSRSQLSKARAALRSILIKNGIEHGF